MAAKDEAGDVTMGRPLFKISRCLEGHEQKQVRCVAAGVNGEFYTGGRDNTLQKWSPRGDSGDISKDTLAYHPRHVSAVYYTPPVPGAANATVQQTGAVITGCADGIVRVHDVQCNQLFELHGHTDIVGSVAVTPDQRFIVSGSWDGTVRIWDWKTEKCVHTEPGFETSVVVLGLPNGTIATGSAGVQTGPRSVGNMRIRILAEAGGSWSVTNIHEEHQHRISQLAVIPGVGFASCSNDSTVMLRSLDGSLLQQYGDMGAEYALGICALDGGDEIAAAMDDGLVRIWRGGNVVQFLPHAREVVAVACLSTGDLVACCPAGKLMVWTRDDGRAASPEETTIYNSEVEAQRLYQAAKHGRQLDPSTLVPADQRRNHPGSKDGQTRAFNKGGKAFTYRWDGASKAWIEVGESTGSAKEMVDGVAYDRVLPVEIDLPGQGLVNVKMGFNDGDNPYSVARNFCNKHRIDLGQIQQIVDFINQNRSNSAPTIGSGSTMADFGDGHVFNMEDLMGGSGGAGSSSSSTGAASAQHQTSGGSSKTDDSWMTPDFPQRLGMTFDSKAKNMGKMSEKIMSIYAKLGESAQDMESLLQTLAELSRYHSSTVSDSQVGEVLRCLSTWPAADQWPVVDLLRAAARHEVFVTRLVARWAEVEKVLTGLAGSAASGATPTQHTYLLLQALSNMVAHRTAAPMALRFFLSDACTGFRQHAASAKHRHVVLGLATVLLNISAVIMQDPVAGQDIDAQAVVEQATALMQSAAATLEGAASGDATAKVMLSVVKRMQVAVGTVQVARPVHVDTQVIDGCVQVAVRADPSYAALASHIQKAVLQRAALTPRK